MFNYFIGCQRFCDVDNTLIGRPAKFQIERTLLFEIRPVDKQVGLLEKSLFFSVQTTQYFLESKTRINDDRKTSSADFPR